MLNNNPLLPFSLIVPAAGHGSRLSRYSPKALAPVGNKTLIELATHSLIEGASESIIIAQSKHQTVFEEEASRISMNGTRVITQDEARGSAHAVNLGLTAAGEQIAVVVWGDHVGAETFDPTPMLDSLRGEIDFVLPIIRRDNPYVYFEIVNSKILGFSETSKGSPQVLSGFSDIGVFGMKVQKTSRILNEWIHSKNSEKDLNFLSFFESEKFQTIKLEILQVNPSDSHLTQGINTDEDLEQFSKIHEETRGQE
jgi:bifunctional N-acetylglucosamine-1-phosphate-uridyltransferase/glucosamine-1-phosphate-acetyltransferase GlmU-like protein